MEIGDQLLKLAAELGFLEVEGQLTAQHRQNGSRPAQKDQRRPAQGFPGKGGKNRTFHNNLLGTVKFEQHQYTTAPWEKCD